MSFPSSGLHYYRPQVTRAAVESQFSAALEGLSNFGEPMKRKTRPTGFPIVRAGSLKLTPNQVRVRGSIISAGIEVEEVRGTNAPL